GRRGDDRDQPGDLHIVVRRARRRRLDADGALRPEGARVRAVPGRGRHARHGTELLMTLAAFWFIVLAVLWTGFLLLEGFDFGVGMLHGVVGRDEGGRDVAVRSIGPVWDGNEVWLITAVAVTFAAFPTWYATMFSGFYPLILVVLVA